jgi:NTP pyrophosphatase (non-canonical NTP hydrolase)
MSYLALAAHCAQASTARGFEPTTFETSPYRLLAMHSEVIEFRKAIEDANDPKNTKDERAKQEAIRDEAADLANYALQVMRNLGATNWTLRSRVHEGPPTHALPETLVKQLHDDVDQAYRAWRRGDARDVCVALEILLAHLDDVRKRCLWLTTSLQEDVAHKLARDAGRPRLNGHSSPRS